MSKLSLEAVILHNGNTLPSIPAGHSVHNKESYEDMKILMEAINYDKFKWQFCGDLKVIALLLGLKQGFTKYCCFICEWDSRARSLHYQERFGLPENPWSQESWMWKIAIHGFKACSDKKFSKAMNQEEAAFTYLREQFPD